MSNEWKLQESLTLLLDNLLLGNIISLIRIIGFGKRNNVAPKAYKCQYNLKLNLQISETLTLLAYFIYSILYFYLQ